MKKIEGTVSDIRKHLFKVDDCFVEITTGDPSTVKDGDTVSVAGYMARGLIRAYAVQNTTEQIIWHQSYVHPFLAGILVIACGFFIVTGFSLPLIVLGCIVILIGILMIARGIAIIRAIKFVTESCT